MRKDTEATTVLKNQLISFFGIKDVCRQAVIDKGREEARQESQCTEFCILSYEK